jgi:hypothetical protein
MSLTVRAELEKRGIDLVEMQMAVYEKAMKAFDSEKGCSDGGKDFGPSDMGPDYLRVCNQAIGTLAKYAYPTMTAIKIEEADSQLTDKVIDAVKVRETILSDPFAARAALRATSNTDTGIPVLFAGKKETNE